MKTETAKKIIDYVQLHGQVTAHELSRYLQITPQAIFRHLGKLIEQKKLRKIGRSPKVFYLTAYTDQGDQACSLTEMVRNVIEDRYLLITPAGNSLKGVEGFEYWCKKQGLDVSKTADEYITTLKKYDAFRKEGLIDGLQKFQSTFSDVFLDRMLYLDFYAIERFGKTKLGQLLLYAKQTQNLTQMSELSNIIRPSVDRILSEYQIDAVGFIPPSVKREVQLMKELQQYLHLSKQLIAIVKIKTPVVVPQKTLSKFEDRVENAAGTIIVTEKTSFKNILLIDDAVGSGATLNETARQIKKKGLCSGELIGLAITGSFKGFDVISEV